MEVLDLLKQFDNLVKFIELIEFTEEEHVSKLKIKAHFFDTGSQD